VSSWPGRRNRRNSCASRFTGCSHHAGTGPEDARYKRFIEEASTSGELYLGIVIDRQTGKLSLWPRRGGADIEEVAAGPGSNLKNALLPASVAAVSGSKLAFGLGLAPELINDAVRFMLALYRAFEHRCLACESIPSW
jgi:succinyl-CoA synthetase beta subunit